MDLRRSLLANAWAQLLLVLGIVVLANTWAARTFARIDLTEDRLYSLDLATRALMYRLEKPLYAKVYFSGDLQAPYNNHQAVLVDKLEDMRAYSKGLMEIEVTDPTNLKELEDEAKRFGIAPIQYRYKGENVTEMKKVFMGVALVYGDKQEVLAAVTQVETLEYDLARAVKSLVTDEEKRTIGWSQGHGEPSLAAGTGPLEKIRTRWQEDHRIAEVGLGGAGPIDESIDALFVVGPQRPLSERAVYQLDQFLMRGGALAIFLTNAKPDMRSMRPQSVYHGLEPLIGHYGIKLNRDLVVDRTRNGQMRFPVRQGKYVVQMPVSYPLIPRATELATDHVVTKNLDSMLFPFVSSLDIAEPRSPDVQATVLAATSEAGGRIKGVATIRPDAYKVVAPGEERGSWPVLVSLTGVWPSYFADKDIPKPPAETPFGDAVVEADDPASKLRESAPTRLVVAGSADFVANNVAFVLNLADWMVEDDTLIGIRSKAVNIPPLDPMERDQAMMVKLVNLAGGTGLLLLLGGVRWGLRRRSGGFKDLSTPAPGTEGDAA